MKWNLFPTLLFLFLLPGMAHAAPPAELSPAELDHLDADKESIGGLFPGALVIPQATAQNTDDKYHQTYHAACYIYVAERTLGKAAIDGYARRFAVYAPDSSALPTARRVARLLLLLWGENNARRHGYDHPARETVQVWLTRQVEAGLDANVGGEQFKNQIYLYDIFAERRPIEWAREVAHEYGHYALVPGISGYRAPEDDSNGVLGERLFLKWLHDDLRAGRLRPDDLPFVTLAQLDDYSARQITPLIHRIAHDGVDPRLLTKTDAGGMDYYIGLALYLDAVYGSQALYYATVYTHPAHEGVFLRAPDFLRGVYESLAGATEITLTLPLLARDSRSESLMVYLPRGEFTVTTDGPIHSWQLPTDAKGVHTLDKGAVLFSIADWRRLTVTLSQPTEAPVRLIFRRRGAEIP